jgi:hypothetical protein
MSLNNNNQAGLFPYSLNNLQTITSNGGALLPTVSGSNITVVNTGLSYQVNLDDDIDINSIIASSGTIDVIDCDTLYANTSIYSNSSLNAPNADVSVYGITANLNGIKSQGNFTGPAIFCNTGTFNKGVKTTNIDVSGNATINNLIISGATIPFLNFTTATGTLLNVNRINSSITGSCEFDYLRANNTVFSPALNLQNALIDTTNNNNIELCTYNNDIVYVRQGPGDTTNQIILDPSISLVNSNNLLWSVAATGALLYLNNLVSTTQTGTNAYFTNLFASNTTASGTFNGNFKVKNPDSIEFSSSSNTQVCKITPSATLSPPSLSYSTTALVGSQLQQTFTTGGTTLSSINALTAQTLQSFDRADLKQLSVNYVGSLSNTATINGNASIGYLVAAPSNGLIVAGNTSIGTTSNVNKLDVSGGVAVGTYAGVNTAPSNSLIVSGAIGIGTGTTAQTLSVNGDASVNNGSWFNRINIASNNRVTTNKGYELDCQGYQRFYSHNNSNGFQLDLGSSGTYSNFRSAYLYKPDASFSSVDTIFLVNQQTTSGNAYAGAIQFAPNNGFGTMTLYGNGQTVVQAKAAFDYGLYINNAPTSNDGYGARIDNSTSGLYLLQLNGKTDDGVFNTALTVHSEGGNNGGVVIGAYPVAPSNTYKLWVAPMRNNSIQDTFIGIANQTFRANGSFQIGMTTGSSSLSPCQLLSTTTANHIDINPFFSQRARFATNGEIFLNGQSTTSSNVTTSTLTLTSVSYFGGGGTSYAPTQGLGNFVPLVNIYFNGGFAIPAGNNLLAATEYYRTDHSAWIGAPVQRLNCDWTGKYSIKANIRLQTDTAGGAYSTFSVWINGAAYTIETMSHIVANGYISFSLSQDIQLNTGDNISFYLFVSAGNDYVLEGSNTSMRYIS